MFGIASATHSDFRDRVLDLVEILRSQLDHRCADVFFETLELARTGNRNDPWLLREKPGQRDLRRRRILVRGDRLQKIDETLIRFACFRSEARKKSSKIGLLEGRVLVHLAGEKSSSQRTVRNEANRSEEHTSELQSHS